MVWTGISSGCWQDLWDAVCGKCDQIQSKKWIHSMNLILTSSLAHFDNLGNESNKPHTPNHIVPFFIHNWNETKSVDSLANLIRLQIFCVQPHSLVRSHVDLFTLWIFEATLHFTIYVFMMGHRHFAKLTMRLIIHHYCRQ